MGANGGSSSNPNPTNRRRDLMLIAGLINYPGFGLILFETGCAEDVETVCQASKPAKLILSLFLLSSLTACFKAMGSFSYRHVSTFPLRQSQSTSRSYCNYG